MADILGLHFSWKTTDIAVIESSYHTKPAPPLSMCPTHHASILIQYCGEYRDSCQLAGSSLRQWNCGSFVAAAAAGAMVKVVLVQSSVNI